MAKNKKRKKAKVVPFNREVRPKKYIRVAARKLPIYRTYVSDEIFSNGMGYAIVMREKRNGDMVLGSYLIDVWCLGVKDTFFRILKSYEYEEVMGEMFYAMPHEIVERDPNYIFNLIYGAAEYAEDLGLRPHKDFSITEYILDEPSSLKYVDIAFGREGRPCFMPGAHDNIGKILKTLNETIGQQAFDYIDDFVIN